MKSNNTEHLTREELQALLADYATGLLDEGLKAMVELGLLSHSDLREEAQSMHEAFGLVNREARNSAIDHATRNLSVHVVQALGRKQRSPYRHLAWLLPAATAVVMFVVLNYDGSREPEHASGIAPSGATAATRPASSTATIDTPSSAETPGVGVNKLPIRDAHANDSDLSNSTTVRRKRTVVPSSTQEELIVDDLVSDQIIDRMVSESNETQSVNTVSITDAEIDVLLAAVVSDATL